MGRQRIDIGIRLAAKTRKTEGCWIWIGNKWHCGYGTIWRNGTQAYVHRVAYELAFGPIPPGQQVCHRCDNRICVRPDHLFLGTLRDNLADMFAKERNARGETHGRHRLTEQSVRHIRERAAAGDVQADLARSLGVHYSAISRIVHGKRWGHVPLEE